MTLEQCWRLLKLERRPPLTRETLNLVGSHHRISRERVQEELGYSPRVAYEEAMERLERALRAGRFGR